MALPARNRLKLRSDFQNVSRRGATAQSHFLFLKYLKSGHAIPRIAIRVPAKIAPWAVLRNKIRRAISEIIRLQVAVLPSMDILITVRAIPKENELEALGEELRGLLRRIS